MTDRCPKGPHACEDPTWHEACPVNPAIEKGDCRYCRSGDHRQGVVALWPHDDWSSPEFVLGAVLAQLEDLTRDEKLAVLAQAFMLMEGTVWEHDGDPSVSFKAGRWIRLEDEGAHEK